MKPHLLGIDIGSTMVKAALFDGRGAELAVTARKIEHASPQPGWDEIDMHRLWSHTCGVIKEALRQSSVDLATIAAVTCTGFGNGLFLVDQAGQPVRAGIGSGDSRAIEYIQHWEDETLDRLLPKTMQRLWPGQPNALLAWLKEYEPQALQKAKWLFMVKDFIRFRLTGRAAAEITDLSGTSLIDVGRGCHDPEILAAWGLADLESIMPAIVQSADLCGTITSQAAAQTGLAQGTPVASGMFDIGQSPGCEYFGIVATAGHVDKTGAREVGDFGGRPAGEAEAD
ncbi:MAG: FGGY family carbohydrate kinase, partial [Planctomycetota bacterium]|nr:FGGY family carbohydrate kinase [Planctomycetota bacterium]